MPLDAPVMTASNWVLKSPMSLSLPALTRHETGPPSLPPGPSEGRVAGTVAFHRDPLSVLRRAQSQFGDLFTMRLTTTGPVVVVADPEAWPLIADADPGWARAGEARREVLPMASALSVFGGDGQTHAAA